MFRKIGQLILTSRLTFPRNSFDGITQIVRGHVGSMARKDGQRHDPHARAQIGKQGSDRSDRSCACGEIKHACCRAPDFRIAMFE
jgi:hypothetical protein